MSYTATNRANIDRLRENRDRAGITQLAEVLATTGHPESGAIVEYARDAIAWIDATSPSTIDADHAAGVRVGDVLTYTHAGHPLQGVVIAITGDTAITNHGHEVDLRRE